jgi:hypothetical protein
MQNLRQCSVCGHIWDIKAGEMCTNVQCPGTAQRRWDLACKSARSLIDQLNADAGSNEDLQRSYAEIGMRFSQAAASDRNVTVRQDERCGMMQALQSWQQRRRDLLARQEAERRAEAKLTWHPVTVRGVDVTEHIAAMYDAIVASTDWGSGFLDDDAIEGILLVASLVGFDVDSVSPPRGSEANWKRQALARARALLEEEDE